MGGFGSGRHGWHGRVEHCRSIDVNRLSKVGALEPGADIGWQWSRNGETVATIGLRGEGSAVRLVYGHRRDDCDEWQTIDYRVPLASVPCRFGGSRRYFVCPGIVNRHYCGRRVAKLYLNGRYFLCRHCYRLAYASQAESPMDRKRRRVDKLRLRMGGDTGCDAPYPPRPKGMWRRTFERELAELDRLEEAADEEFSRYFLRRFGTTDIRRLLR